MKNRLVMGVFLVCGLLSLYSFRWGEVDKDLVAKQLEEMSAHLKTLKSYSVELSHASFEDYKTLIAHEKSAGYLKMENSKFHSYISGVHTIQNENCRILVDSMHKTIAITDPIQSINYIYSLSDYRKFLDVCQSIKTTTVKKSTLYRFEFLSNFPLSAYELVVNSEKLPEKITLYYNRELKKTNNAVPTRPRMEIAFTKWIKNVKLEKRDFDEKGYVYKKGDKFLLNESYTTLYKLLDQRVTTR